MIIWQELEERVQAGQWNPIESEQEARNRIALAEEMDNDRQPLRRRVASAFIQLGVKIDPEAAEDIVTAEVVAA